MAGLNYNRFVRILTRCSELAVAPDKPPIIGLVYKERAEQRVTAFLESNKAVTSALTAFAKENKEAIEALKKLDAPYRVARSSVLAILPETELPETLKKQPTDTDKLNAIEELLDIIDDYPDKPWAAELLKGEFGQLAPKTVKELNEAITASTTRSNALATRAAAYGPAYEAYLAFKRVVRDALGPSSKDYRRIHLRASPGADDTDQQDGEPAEDTTQPEPENNASKSPPDGDPSPK